MENSKVVMENNVIAAKRRAVSFSEMSEMRLVFNCRGYLASAWYSNQEITGVRQAFVQDMRMMISELSDTPPEALTKHQLRQQLSKCIGMESFITEGLAERLTNRKLEHRNAVLLEQRLQQLQGITDIEKLARVSQMHSSYAEERARKLAEVY